MLGGLSRRGLLAPGDLLSWRSEVLAATAAEAVLISALTCERIGADPPFARTGRPGDPLTPLTRADLGFSGTSQPAQPDGGLAAVCGALRVDASDARRLRLWLMRVCPTAVVGE